MGGETSVGIFVVHYSVTPPPSRVFFAQRYGGEIGFLFARTDVSSLSVKECVQLLNVSDITRHDIGFLKDNSVLKRLSCAIY